jgi:Mg-chelatase subunit ChlI
MKPAIAVAAIDHGIGRVLTYGPRDTGKSTTSRVPASLAPPIKLVQPSRRSRPPPQTRLFTR